MSTDMARSRWFWIEEEYRWPFAKAPTLPKSVREYMRMGFFNMDCWSCGERNWGKKWLTKCVETCVGRDSEDFELIVYIFSICCPSCGEELSFETSLCCLENGRGKMEIVEAQQPQLKRFKQEIESRLVKAMAMKALVSRFKDNVEAEATSVDVYPREIQVKLA